MWRFMKATGMTLGVLVAALLVMQLIPYGRAHDNPPVVQEPAWDSPRTRELAVRACFDCHSNETKWPWYSHVAPMSWVVQREVDVGRSVLNFSEWTREYELASASGTSVISREMPPAKYRWVHEESVLTHEEKVELADGMHATFGELHERVK